MSCARRCRGRCCCALVSVLCEVVVVDAGFFSVASPVEAWPALAAETQANIASAPAAMNRALRICVRTSAIPRNLYHKNKKPNGRWHCNHPRWGVQCQFPLGSTSVTEVYRPGRWFHPAATSRAAGPGRPRPGRSSGSTRPSAKSSSLFTGCLFTSRMMSPRPRFTSSANEPGFTSCTITPLPGGHIETVGHLRRHLANGHSELALLGSALVVVLLIIAEPRGKQLGAIGDGHRRLLRSCRCAGKSDSPSIPACARRCRPPVRRPWSPSCRPRW